MTYVNKYPSTGNTYVDQDPPTLYMPPSGDNVVFDLLEGYEPPQGDEVVFILQEGQEYTNKYGTTGNSFINKY